MLNPEAPSSIYYMYMAIDTRNAEFLYQITFKIKLSAHANSRNTHLSRYMYSYKNSMECEPTDTKISFFSPRQ